MTDEKIKEFTEAFIDNPLRNRKTVDWYTSIKVGVKLVKVIEVYTRLEDTVILVYDDESYIVFHYNSCDKLVEFDEFEEYKYAKRYFIKMIE